LFRKDKNRLKTRILTKLGGRTDKMDKTDKTNKIDKNGKKDKKYKKNKDDKKNKREDGLTDRWSLGGRTNGQT
jgi:hypothetical protein